MTTGETLRAYRGPALFSYGFRPFFLGAAVWTAISAPVWALAYLGELPLPFATRDWHVHEMLYGYLAAAVAGFLLTAIPNWTGRLPVSGPRLAMLFALWLGGRIAMLAPPGPLPAALDSLFLIGLVLVIAREVVAGGNLKNLPVVLLVSVLAFANIAFHLRASLADPALPERAALSVVAMLVALIGGRITPSFTRNWLAKKGDARLPAPTDRLDQIALALTALALVAWAAVPASFVAGVLLIAAGLALATRLARWRGSATRAEPLLLVLHIGYLWEVVALVLLGTSVLAPDIVARTAGVHALTTGAFGTMTLAVMTRASLGHTGRALTAGAGTSAIYLLVTLAALARVAAAFLPQTQVPLLSLSALAWFAAFASFAAIYGPYLASPRKA